MAESGKKISFSFSKVVKSSLISKAQPKEANDKQYIDCLDSNSIIVKNRDHTQKAVPQELVIPMRNPTISRTLEAKQKNSNANKVEDEQTENGAITLDDIATKEILEESKKKEHQIENAKVLKIPASQNENLQQESTPEDYEKIPVEDFGKAMLRGMGWRAGQGIGKQGKVASTFTPQLRPRGMGLGADKAKTTASISGSRDDEEQELKLLKGNYVQMISGTRKGQYGEIQGMDEDSGRLVIKMALNSECVSVSESVVKVVSKHEYDKNSRVLNISKFDDYKKRPEKHDKTSNKHLDEHRKYLPSKKRHKRSSSPTYKHSKHRTGT